MRVIAGSARRLTLVTPKGNNTRPTSDKVKETLFNILAGELSDINFLDLFAGSGGIGIEALSRGASHCTFVEKDKSAVAAIRRNIATTHFEEQSTIYPYDVMSCLHTIDAGEGFDIVFMDPPYGCGLEKDVLTILAGSDIIKEDALIIAEASSDTSFDYLPQLGFAVSRVKDYRNNKHVFIVNKERI